MSKPTVRNPSKEQIKASTKTGKIDADIVIRPSSNSRGGNKVLTLVSTEGVNQIQSGQVRAIIQALLYAKDQGFTATRDELCDSFNGGDSLLERAGLITDQAFHKVVDHYTSGHHPHLVGYVDVDGVPYKVTKDQVKAKRKSKVSAKQQAHTDMINAMKL